MDFHFPGDVEMAKDNSMAHHIMAGLDYNYSYGMTKSRLGQVNQVCKYTFQRKDAVNMNVTFHKNKTKNISRLSTSIFLSNPIQ